MYVLSPHNMSSSSTKNCLPSSCLQNPSFSTEITRSFPPPYLNLYWLFPLSVQQNKFHTLFAGMSLDVEFCLSLTLGLHISYVSGEEQPLTPLSEYLSLSTDLNQVASCLKPMVICYKVITDYLITI